MPTSTPNKARELFGLSWKSWRTRNNLSQRNLHVFCDALGIKLYDSQFSHLENGTLVFKPDSFVELKKLNNAIISKKFPPTVSEVGKFTQELKLKFKHVQPYLDANNKPVKFGYILTGMFTGELPLNETYLNFGFSQPEADNCTAFMTAVFNAEVKKRKLTKKDAFADFEPLLKKLGFKDHYRFRLKEVIVYNEEPWTADEMNDFTNNKTTPCPIRDALCDWTGFGSECPSQQDICDKGVKLLKRK
jgi:hypothetical protein